MFSKSHNHQSVADNKEHESDSKFFDLSPLPLPTGAVGVSAWNSCRSLNDVYLDYGPGFEPLEKSIRAIFGLVTAMIVILVVTSLAMELREYVKYQRFSPGDLVEFSPTHGIASGLFLLITAIHYLFMSGPLVPMPSPLPIRFNRQRREVAYVTKRWRRPRFVAWENVVARVSCYELVTVYGIIKCAHLMIGLDGKSGSHTSWIAVPTHTMELAMSEWEIIRAYMEGGVKAVLPPMRPGEVEEGTVEFFHIRRRYCQSECDYLHYLFKFLPMQLFSGWTLPCHIAALINRMPFVRLPDSILEWSKPLPPEQWQAPSAELIAQSEEVRKSLRKGMTIFEHFSAQQQRRAKDHADH
ncbi:hypothetical protein [Pseudomonas syringae]|uniref:hypothetical protein n=1 Tax=Pseudomonas syringae TaxID=317 RepID=UPI000AB27038|nr:hypothetical protein [Pseudomonas syringae]